ncbi:MAG: FHA domain-containing protein [Holophagaceae bacterium]|nr:FHA domain-containing protein [Holophagaceae bacterium]
MAKLLVHESAGVREFEMVDNEVHIGRELDNTLRLADPSISRHHCVIRLTANGYEVQDLQSSNGVLLNGSRVQTSPLRDGDRVTLGQIQITFMDPAQENATVAVQRMEPPSTGTVRMSPDQMAQVHGTHGVPAGPPAVPPPPPSPAPPPPPAMSPIATTPAPMQHMPESRAPEFGHFTDPGAAARPGSVPLPISTPARPYPAPTPAPVAHGGYHPVPAPQSSGFLGKFLPPIPDDAQPTGERGDFVTRLIAVIIDSVVIIPVMIVMFIFSFVVGIVANKVPALGMIAGCLGMIFYIVAVFGYFLYFIPRCVSKHGATIGKKMMKLRIVPEDDPHGRLTFGQALIRQICHIANFTFGYLLIFGAERKAVHDMITKTIVIKVDR